MRRAADSRIGTANNGRHWTAVSTHVVTLFGQVKLYARLPVKSDRNIEDELYLRNPN
jgi:hypothetical protein